MTTRRRAPSGHSRRSRPARRRRRPHRRPHPRHDHDRAGCPARSTPAGRRRRSCCWCGAPRRPATAGDRGRPAATSTGADDGRGPSRATTSAGSDDERHDHQQGRIGGRPLRRVDGDRQPPVGLAVRRLHDGPAGHRSGQGRGPFRERRRRVAGVRLVGWRPAPARRGTRLTARCWTRRPEMARATGSLADRYRLIRTGRGRNLSNRLARSSAQVSTRRTCVRRTTTRTGSAASTNRFAPAGRSTLDHLQEVLHDRTYPYADVCDLRRGCRGRRRARRPPPARPSSLT